MKVIIILLLITVVNCQNFGGEMPDDGNDLLGGLPSLPSNKPLLPNLKLPANPTNTKTVITKKQPVPLPNLGGIKPSKKEEETNQIAELSEKMEKVNSMEDLVKVFKLDNQLSLQKEQTRTRMVAPPPSVQYTFTRVGVGHRLREDGTVMDNSFIVLPNKGCSPTMTIINTRTLLKRHKKRAGLFWPICFELPKCGGSCHGNLRECTPVKTQKLVRSFILITSYGGYDTIKHELTEHKSCECLCKLKPKDCVGYQQFNWNNCRCECSVHARKRCKANKQWSPSSCNCICSNQHPKCGRTGVWNPDACRCIRRPRK